MTPATRLTRGEATAWVAIALLTAYFVFIGGASAGWLYPQVRAVNVAILTGVLVVWAIAAWRDPKWRPRSAIWPGVVAALAAFSMSTVLSRNARLSVEYLAYAVLLASLYLLLVRIVAHPALRVRMIGLAGGLAGLISLLYIAAVVRRWVDWWGVVGHLATPPLRPGYEGLVFTDPGGTAAVTVLLASPVVAWLAIRSRSARVAAVALAVAVGIVVVLTGARGAWLGVAVAAVVSALVAITIPSIRGAVRVSAARVPRWLWVAIAAVAIVAAVVAGPSVVRRALTGGGDDLRFTLALTGVRMFRESPLTGVGPGNWAVSRTMFTEPDEVDYYIPHAHNVYAQTAAEFGIVGIAATLVLAFVVGRLVVRSLHASSTERQALALAAIFSLTYLAIHQLVDMYLNVPAILFAGVLPVALLDASAAAEDIPALARVRVAGRALAVGLAAASIAAVLVIAAVEARAIPAAPIGDLADKGDWARAAELAQTAVAGDPDLPAYWFMNGLAAARAGDTATAEQEFERTAAEDDYAFAWLNLAAMRQARGDDAGARESLKSALRLGRQQPAITLPAGVLYLRLGDTDAAVDAFADAIRAAPMITDDPFWQSDGDELASAHDKAVDKVIAEAPVDPDALSGLASLVALLNGEPDRATDATSQLIDGERLVTQLAILAWQGDARALADLERIVQADASNRPALTWLARLAAKRGDAAAIQRYRTWIAATTVLGRDIGEDVVVTDTPIPGAQVPGANGNFQGWYVYQRQYPWDLLVPGLPKLTLH